MVGDFLPPVVTELKADIGDFLAKIEAAKRAMADLGRQRGAAFSGLTNSADGALRKVVQDARKAGQDSGDAFSGGFINRLQQAWNIFGKGFKSGRGNPSGFFGNIAGFGKGIFGGMKDLFTAGGAFGPIVGSIGGAAGGLGFIAVLGAAAAALSGLGGGLLAAGLGLGSFAGIAIPAFKSLSAGVTALNAAQTQYAQASDNLNISIHHSAQNMAQWNGVIAGLDPNLRGAARLLLNQNVQWQNLTGTQQKNVIALSQNQAALKNMSPAMSAALTALLNQKAAWQSLTPQQQKASTAMGKLSSAWKKMQQALEPTALNVATKFLKAFQPAIPYVERFAKAAGKALGTLATDLGKTMKTKDFKKTMNTLIKEAGPAIVILGKTIGRIIGMLGHFFTFLGKKDSIKVFKASMELIAAAIQTVIFILEWCIRIFLALYKAGVHLSNGLSKAADWIKNALTHAFQWIIQKGQEVIKWFEALPGKIKSGLSSLPGILFHLGAQAIQGLINGLKSIPVIGTVIGIGQSIVGGLMSHLHINSPSKVTYAIGQGVNEGLILGMLSMVPHVARAATTVAASAVPSMGGSGFGGAVTTPPSGGFHASVSAQPIAVYVDGKKLFQIMQGRTLGYNVANNRRTRAGSATGVMAT